MYDMFHFAGDSLLPFASFCYMRSFSTPAVIFTVSQIDEEKGILHKVIVASAGKSQILFWADR